MNIFIYKNRFKTVTDDQYTYQLIYLLIDEDDYYNIFV